MVSMTAGKRATQRAGTDKATYVYALVHARSAPDLGRAPRGMPGASAPFLLDAGRSLWAVAARAPLKSYGEAAIERGLADLSWVSRHALTHEAMVEHLMPMGTVVPMKMLTLFASDERALAHLAQLRPRLDRTLARLSGCVEYGLTLWFEPRGVEVKPPKRSTAAARSPGAGFLLRKKLLRDAEVEARQHARSEASQVFEQLAERSRDARRKNGAGGGMPNPALLDAAFLVRRAEERRFRVTLEALTTRLGPRGYRMRSSGPWPPYHFVDLS